MASIEISIPESLRAFIDEQVKAGGYASDADYVRKLIEHARELEKADQRRVDALLLEGVESEPLVADESFWKDVRRRIDERVAERRE